MDDIKKAVVGFTQVTNIVIRDENLSWKAKGIYSMLFSKPDGWQFSTRRIALEAKDGTDSTLSGIQELEHAGYIQRIRQSDGRVTYKILIDPHTENPDEPHTGNPSEGKPQRGQTRTVSNKELIVINTVSNKEVSDFSFFWSIYPKRIGKGAAEKSWKKLKPDIAIVTKAIEAQKLTEQWSKDNGKFIPYPATWLNQRRWEDEVEEQEVNKTVIL